MKMMILIPAFIVSALLIGFHLTNLKHVITFRIVAWLYAAVSVSSIIFLTTYQTPFLRMLAIVIILLLAMKIIVIGEYQLKTEERLSFVRWTIFSLGWAGMRPEVFLKRAAQEKSEAKNSIFYGIGNMIIGLLIVLMIRIFQIHFHFAIPYYFYSVIALVAFSQILHFGLLRISAGVWKILRFPTKPLFKSPYASASLEEFWGRRWNVAFSEMTSIAVFKPVAASTSKITGILAAFIFSGVLHELAISVPVNNGYGFPLLYFFIQGLAIIIENHIDKTGSFLKQPVIARIWTWSWIIVPLPFLFHPDFLEKIILPMAGLNLK
jgi:alginate O-acetyltransferase complex protein AlgI